MIQRIQSVYWLAVAVLLAVTAFLPLGSYEVAGQALPSVLRPTGLSGAGGSFQSTWGLVCILILNAVLAVATIFLYKNRVLQMRLTVFSIVLEVGYYAAAGVFLFVMNGETAAQSFRLGMGLACPLVCIILNVLALRATGVDEAMVRAANRLWR